MPQCPGETHETRSPWHPSKNLTSPAYPFVSIRVRSSPNVMEDIPCSCSTLKTTLSDTYAPYHHLIGIPPLPNRRPIGRWKGPSSQIRKQLCQKKSIKVPRLRVFTAHVTGYQAAHSLLRTVTPLAPEIVFQLSNIKVCWTDKCTVLFRPPFPDQTEGNKVYKMHLQRPPTEEDQTLLQWLRYHQTSGAKPKPYTDDRVLVGVKYVSLFNPIFFYQHLTMNFPHREAKQLRHAEEDTTPETIKHFAQSIAFTPQNWDTAETITAEFEHEGHKAYFINTIVSYVQSFYDILYLWRNRVITNQVGDLSSLFGLPLSAFTSSNRHTRRHHSRPFFPPIFCVRRQPSCRL